MPTRRQLANAIRALSMDAVQKANSGHPGMPMGMADIAQVLWTDHLKHNPGNPEWADRDRFVLSNGHGSMLLYSLLHLTGYPLTIDDLASFRQFGSHTAGHPEVDRHLGIETTTGPLGQGLANAVGMALAEKLLAASFNRPGHEIVDHHTYVFLGDGCLMEGVSHEACSLAGTLKLGKLICFYDDNGISIDGEVHGWFTDDTPKRFEAYGWHVVPNVDGHDAAAIEAAIQAAKADPRPSLICCKTIIGWGSPNKQGTEATHGAPLGDAEVAATRAAARLDRTRRSSCRTTSVRAGTPGRRAPRSSRPGSSGSRPIARPIRISRPNSSVASAATCRPAGAGSCRSSLLPQVEKPAAIATRSSSQQVLNVLGAAIPEMLGGSADLTGSNNTNHKLSKPVGDPAERRQLHPLRRARIRHVRDHERHRAARRLHSVRRHVPRVLRLRAQRSAHGGADEAARRARVHARLDRPRRGRPDAPAGRARRQPAPDPQHAGLAPVRYRRDGRRLGRFDRPRDGPDEPDPHAPGAAADAAHAGAGRRNRARRLRADRQRRRAGTAC